VLAFVQASALMPVPNLVQRISDAKAYFGDFVVRAHRAAFGQPRSMRG
jgi:hypothetical protein